MSNLKDLTWEHHQNAERQEFVKELMKGISNERYAQYLYNQFPLYELLEALGSLNGLFDDMPELKRAQRIKQDYLELWPHKDRAPTLCPVVEEYVKHLKPLMRDSQKLMAHIYVRHMGDLSGGQIIAKRVPGSGKFYEFDKDVDELKEIVRKKINDDMAEEARICFDFAAKLFQQLMEHQP